MYYCIITLMFVLVNFAPTRLLAEYADAIVASVDGNPITLFELSKKIKRKITLKEVAQDSEAKVLLDDMIAEKLLQLEAEQKRVGATDEEIESYIDEVAKQNSMTREQFIAALAQEKKTLPEYKKTVQLEIIKSKLGSTYLKGSVAVTDQDIEQYAKSNGLLADKNPVKVRLKQILISKSMNSPEKIALLKAEIREKLDDGEDFEDLAKTYSEAPEAEEGGGIGEISINDLDRQVFEAVSVLSEEESSNFVEDANSVRIFYLEEKIESSDDEKPELDEATKESIRKTLESEKLQTESANFFNQKLYENHSVEKKI